MIARSALLLFLCLFPKLQYAQKKHYNIVNYNTDNGLPQNSVTGIQFDRKGYCWLGTQMGLVRFDGQRFSVFGSDNIPGLRSDRILTLTRDSSGCLFASTGGIVHVLKINDTSSLAASTPVLLSQPEPDIPTHGFAAPFPWLNTIKYDLVSYLTYGMATGDRYLIQPDGSYYITAGRKIPLSFEGYCPRYRISFTGQHLVMLRKHDDILVWEKENKLPQPALYGPLWNDPDFVKDNFGTLRSTDGAYVYAGKTLYRLSLNNDTLFSEAVLDGIEIPGISCVCVDKRSNTFYIGSGISGLFIIKPADFYTPPLTAPAINLGFYSQSVTDEGILSQHLLFRRDGTVKEYPMEPHSKATWYRPETRSLYYAPGLSLLRFDLATGKMSNIASLPTPLSSIFPDPEQKEALLFSTGFTIGKLVHDTVTGEKRIPGLTKVQELSAIYPYGRDTFLLATWAGVKWYDYRHNKIFRSILDSLIIRQLYAESPQRIWVASYGKGWYLYNNGRIIRMPDGPMNALKTVNAIINDGRGCFWISSNNGLFKASRQALIDYAEGRSEEVYFYAFTTQDHLPSNEFNGCNPSYVWLPDSMLSLPNIKGLVWFYPHKIHLSLPDKGIYIEHIYVDETEVSLTDGRLILSPDHGRLDLVVSSPYFGNKENMKLQFRIEGLDEEWHNIPGSGDIMIERIPAGTFSLVVKKAAGMDRGQYVQIELPIRIYPHWYNTRLFYLLLLFLSVIFVYWLVKLRTRLLQTRNRKLKTQVALQTRDLNRMIGRLTRSEEALKQSNQTKDNIITTVLHDLRSPVRFIYTISKHVASDHRTMRQDALDGHLQELKNSTASLNSFTDQFFTWALSQHRAFAARYSQEPLADLFRETETLYADIMSANGNRLVVMPTALYCYTDPQLLSAILRNLLDNANKNTRNGVVTLATVRTEHKVIITVSDTGKGFQPEALRDFLNKDKTDPRGGKGSFIILHLIDLLEGYLEAVSEPGRGTEFRIVLLHQDSTPGSRPAG